MKKKLHRFILTFVIIVIVELSVLSVFGGLYFANVFELQSYNDELLPIIFSCFAILVVLNIVLTWVSVSIISRMRRKSDISAAELIGGDIQEAYNFAEVGLVLVDENDTIMWINDLFKERQFDILDTNVYQWLPKLEEFKTLSSEAVVQIEYNSRNYSVKYLQEAGLYIFKDQTSFEEISDFSKKHATVIGIIMIDNYSDVSDNQDDSNDIISKIRNEIFEYVRRFKVQIRRYKNDAYYVVCNYESLSKMEEDKFSLLERIHEIGEKEDVPPTISIGLSHGFPDVIKLNEMAENAIKVAMTRGGDQVVVSKYGEDRLQFYGGKFEAQENRNKVKVRVMADSVLSLIRQASNIIIMSHTKTDMDAIGSCLGIKAICEHLHKDSVVVYEPRIAETKTRGAVTTSFSREDVEKIFVNAQQAQQLLRSNTLVILCDVHKPSMTIAPKLLEEANKVMVFDHHRRGEEFVESPIFSHIDPSASSAVELVTELIQYSSSNPRIIIPSAYATIMLSGIFMDSNFFKAKTVGIRTFEASMVLKEFGADNSKADDFLKDEFEEYALITDIISTRQTPYLGVVYCKANEDDIIEQATLAKVGNQLMQMKGVNACFVIGHITDKDVGISCRSDGTINVQILAEQLNGGGHLTQAGGEFKNSTIDRVESRLKAVLNDYLNEARSVKEQQ